MLNMMLQYLPPSIAHDAAVKMLKYGEKYIPQKTYGRPVEFFNKTFPNRVGFAAGFDKTGEAFPALLKLGFGFVEVGSFTPHKRKGNPLPRIWRDRKTGTVVNKCGLPNPGFHKGSENIRNGNRYGGIVGASVHATPGSDTPGGDLSDGAMLLLNVADYVVLNISCPNTADKLTVDYVARYFKREHIEGIFNQEDMRRILIKTPGCMGLDNAKYAAEAVKQAGLGGLVIGNTIKTDVGGYSGPIIWEMMVNEVRCARLVFDDNDVIIACGGIDSGDRANAAMEDGADLVQAYAGFVHKGLGLLPELVDATM